MKIKNIAFFGIMASILAVAGAEAATATNVTTIASKQYVDARDTAVQSAAASDATSKANAAQTAAEQTAASYTDTKVAALDGSITATAGQPFTSISETDGVVTASTGTITTAAFDTNTLKEGVDANSTHSQLPTAKAVYDAVNTANTTLANLDLSAVTSTGKAITSVSQSDGQVSASVGTIDVEHGIDAAAKATAATVDITTNGGSDTKMVTEGGLKKVITDLDVSGVDGSTSGEAVIAVSQSDGKISATLGAVGTAGIASGAVTTAKIDDLAVTTGKINDLAVDTSKIAGSAVTSAKIDDGTIVNADVSDTAAIQYKKMEDGLKDINTDAAVTCSAANPCVVTYLGNGNYNYTTFEYADPAVTNATSGSGTSGSGTSGQ